MVYHCTQNTIYLTIWLQRECEGERDTVVVIDDPGVSTHESEVMNIYA